MTWKDTLRIGQRWLCMSSGTLIPNIIGEHCLAHSSFNKHKAMDLTFSLNNKIRDLCCCIIKLTFSNLFQKLLSRESWPPLAEPASTFHYSYTVYLCLVSMPQRSTVIVVFRRASSSASMSLLRARPFLISARLSLWWVYCRSIH